MRNYWILLQTELERDLNIFSSNPYLIFNPYEIYLIKMAEGEKKKKRKNINNKKWKRGCRQSCSHLDSEHFSKTEKMLRSNVNAHLQKDPEVTFISTKARLQKPK